MKVGISREPLKLLSEMEGIFGLVLKYLATNMAILISKYLA